MNIASIEVYTLPSFWAVYLINGDCTHMNDEEILQCDNHVKGLGHCTQVSEETHFATFKGIGHEVAEFTFVVWEGEEPEIGIASPETNEPA